MVSRRHTPPTTNFTKNLISRLTKRTDNPTQQFWPAQAMNSEETAAFLRSLVHGQNAKILLNTFEEELHEIISMILSVFSFWQEPLNIAKSH